MLYKLSRIVLLSILLMGSHWANAQVMVHYWNFNNSATEADLLAPSQGNGSILHIQGGSSAIQITSNINQGFENTNPNARNGDLSGAHLRFNTPIGGLLEFALPTSGYQQVQVKYATRRSGSGAGVQYVSYSTDGNSYQLFDSIFPVDGDPTLQTLDFSSIAAVNNNPNFKIRLSFAAGPGSTGGNNRFDNFTLEGNNLPSLVHYWNFNNSTTEADLLAPSQGNGSIQHIQGGSSAIQITSNINQGFEITNPNARNGDLSGSHLRFNTPIGGMLEFALPTAGAEQVVVKYATRRSGSGAGVQYIHYSTDGSNFQLFDSIFPVDGNPSMHTLDFSQLSAVENNPNFKIRISFAAGPGSTGGNNRFDNFTLEGVTANNVDTFPPVARFVPLDGSVQQSINVQPLIIFSESMQLSGGQAFGATQADTILQLFNTANNQAVAFSTQLSGDTLRVVPTAALQSNATYTLAIRDGFLTDLAGNALPAGRSTTFSTLPPQTAFQPGDWLPVAFRMNATGTPDAAAFLTFVDILPGTVVYLADAKYTTNTPAQCAGGITWTAPASGVARGTVIEIGTDAGTASIGTITGNTFGLSSSGDQVMVYAGSNTQPTYLTALSANAWLATNTSCGGNNSMLPATLVDGVSALSLSTAPGNSNGLSVNAYYSGPQTGMHYRDSIMNTAYWVVSGAGTAAQQWPNWGFPGPPAVANAQVISATSIQIAFTQDMLAATISDTANYTGIQGFSGIQATNNGSLPDTVLLTFQQPFVNGTSYSLTVSNVQNSDSLVMGLPFSYNFTYNTLLSFTGRYMVVDENAGTVSLPLALQFPSTSSFVVRLRAQSNADAQDHNFVAQTIQITGNSLGQQLVQFNILDDQAVEDDEFLIFEIDSLQGVQWQGPTYFTVYIRDNDRTLPMQDSAVSMSLLTSFDPSATGSTTEVVVYDKVNRRLLATSAIENRFDIINFSNPAQPTTISSVSMTPYGGITSVAVKAGLIAVASPNNNEQLPGSVVFFDPQGNYISQVTVGSLPDMLVFSPDGNRLLVANEGQPNTDFSVDPEGSVSIINTSSNSITQADVTTVDFTAFNAQEATLVAAGVRKGSTIGTLSQNLEPEYITVADDNSKAWVTLQENNSIAEINLINNTITQIWGMGLKDNSVPGNGFDASDNIPEALLVAWPTKMYYMPDAMGQFSIGGNTYLVTANEGDEREYSVLDERTSVGASSTVLDPATFPHADMLKENHAIGRLRITNQNGDYDNDGDFDDVINVGSRSMSIWNAQSGAQVWDSKNQIELITLLDPTHGSLFNSDHEENDRKGRSRSKGPEPEGLAMAKVGDRHFAFVGLERIGGIIAYEVTDPNAPVFNGYLNPRSTTSETGDRGPETMVFIPANESPDGQAYLVVANEISGTLSIIRLQFNFPQANPNYSLQILHASDMEGGLDAPKDAPGFAAVIDQLENNHPNTLILSSGDNFIPSPFLSAGEDPSVTAPLRAATSLFFPGQQAVRAAIGRPDIAILNLIGFNASVFGNHEFDLGTGELNNMIGVDIRSGGADKRWVGAQFPYLSANLDFSADPNLAYLVTADGQSDTTFRTPANITANNQKKGIARSVVIERGGEKIGIVGATTQVLASISSPGNTTVVGPTVNDMPALAAVLQPVIDSLRNGQGINKIIVLSHLQQLSLEQALAPLLNGVDVIIAGGSHSLLADSNDILRPGDLAVGTYPIISQGADNQPLLIVNTQSEYKYVGRLVLEFDTNGVILTQALDPLINGAYATDSAGVARVWGNHAAAFAPGTKGANVKALTDVMQTVIVAKDGNIFGKASVFLEGRREFTRTEETNLGNLTADANLWQARQADPTVALSLKNGGGIRQPMGTVNAVGSTVALEPTAPNPSAGKQQGDISQLDIENSMRFNNRLSVLTIPVSGIKAMLEHGVAQTAPGATPGRFPQVGGMAFSFDPSQPVNSRIQSLVRIDSAGNIIDTLVRNGQVHGDPTRTYKLVTLNFLAGGGDGYPFPQYAATRVDLDTVITAAGGATFTVPGSEQDAFAEYMLQRFPASSPYSIAETPAAQDFRIQDLSRRSDSLLPVQPNYSLQILHASDMEGGLDAPKDAPGFAAVIDQLENNHPNTLILSSGDNFIPSPFLSAGEDPSVTAPLRAATSLFFPGQQAVRAAIGRPDIAILNLIGFNASVFGNHEFDLGTGELNNMIGVDIRSGGADKRWVGAQFPYLSANLDFSADPNLAYLVTADGQSDTTFRTPANITANNQKKGIARSVVIERGGEKIGIVGATTQVLASISSPGNTTVVGPTVNDMPALAAVLQPVIDSLRNGQGINKIIVLSHLQQLSLEQALAPLLNGVDVIIAGGSHSLLADSNDILRPGDLAVGTYPIISQGADNQPLLIVNTQSEYKYVGRLVLEFDTNGVILTQALDPLINGAYATDSAGVARVWGNHAAAFAPGTKGANVKALTDVMQTVIVAKDGNIFGKASVFLEGRREFTRTEETNLGNLTADANLWQARQADPTVALSLKNGGGIRQPMGTVNAVGSTVALEPTAPNPSAGKQQGDISQLDIENSMRFNNRLSVLTIPVSGIKAMLEHGVAQTAPGATPGRFPQVGGMAFSFDPSQPVNSRIQSLVRIDSAGNIIDTLVRNGQVHGDPTRTYKLVTLNFLAGGGDGYPFPQYAATRVDLDTVITAAGGATFTVPGSEQDAFAEYMLQRFPASSPYSIAETPAAQDFRIQDLSRRNDSLLPFDFATLLAPANNSRLATQPGSTSPVQIRWAPAIGAQSYKWSLTSASGNFAPGLVNLPSNSNGTDTTLDLTVGAIDNLLASLGVAPGDSIDTRWTVKSFYNNGNDSTLAPAFNLRLVRLALPQAFSLLNPANNARLVSIPNDNTPVTINWTASTNATTYRWVAALASGSLNSPIVTLNANNGGADTALSLTLGSIDALLASLSVGQGDSVDLQWSVRAINAAGTDSLLASSPRNIRLVRQAAQPGAFSLLTPATNTRLLTAPSNNSPVTITWQAATNATSYTWLVDFPNGDFSNPIIAFPAANGGTATQLVLLNRSIDSLLNTFAVLPGDSSDLIWTVRATNGTQQRLATSAFNIRLVRDAQISSFNLLAPANNGRLEVRGPASTPVTISWQAATSPAAAPLSYTWLADPAGNFSMPFLSLPADNGGAATQLTLTTGAIDTVLAAAGVAIGDSISLQWTVRATTGVSSRDAASTFTVRLIRVGLTSSTFELAQLGLQLYPNPANARVYLRTEGVPMQQIVVYNLNGAEVLRTQPEATDAMLDVQELPAGLYIVRIQTAKGMINRRLVVGQ